MKHVVLSAALLLSGIVGAWAQDPALVERPSRMPRPAAGLAPVEALLKRTEASRPTATVRQVGRISYYNWDRTAAQWSGATVHTYTYNNLGLIASIVATDSASQAPVLRFTYTYNPAGHTTLYFREAWLAGSWQNDYRFSVAYDAQGRVTEYLDQEWSNGAWQNTYRDQYTYNPQGQVVLAVYQQWANNAWSTYDGQQDSYVYDANNRLTEQRTSFWDTNANAFVPNMRYLYSYSGANRTYDAYDAQTWTNGTWQNARRFVGFVYTTQGRPSYYETLTWDGAAWRLASRTTYAYAAGNPGYSYLTEQPTGTAWQNASRYTLSYDAQGSYLGNLTEDWRNNAWVPVVGFQYAYGYAGNNDISRRLYRTVSNGALVNFSKSFYSNYQTIVLGNRPAVTTLLSTLCPNPTKGAATLALGGLASAAPVQVTVFNILGQVVQQHTVRPQAGAVRHTLHLAELPAGVYTVRAAGPDGTAAQRLVRE